MLKNYVLVTWRTLKRNSLFAAINVFGLGIALACCLLLLLYIIHDHSYDSFHRNVDRLYRITCTMTKEGEDYEVSTLGHVQRGVGQSLKKGLPEVEEYLRLESLRKRVFKVDGKAFFEDVLVVDPGFFQFFSFELKNGNPAKVLESPESIVITKEKALKYFGTTDVVGRNIDLLTNDIVTPLTVTAVAENPPQNSSIRFGMVLTMALFDKLYRNGVEEMDFDWVNLSYTTIIKLGEETDAVAVGDKLNGVIHKYGLEKMEKVQQSLGVHFTYAYQLQAFEDIHMDEEVVSPGFENMSSPLYVLLLGVIAGFILLIALLNFINLSLAQSVKRYTEVGIRKVLGSSKVQLFTRFVGESLLLCFLAFLLAILLVFLFLPYFNALIGKDLSMKALLNRYVITGSIAIFLISTLAAGIYPSLMLSRLKPSRVLSGIQKIHSKQIFTKGLVTVQFSMSILLIIATIMFHRQFNYLLNKELGYKDENLIEVEVPFHNKDYPAIFRKELDGNPTILSISGGKIRNEEGGGAFAVKYDGKQETVVNAYVDADFLPATGIQLLEGENYSPGTPGGGEGIIVNEAFLIEFNIDKPLEAILTFPWERDAKQEYATRHIRGVVKDFHFGSLHNVIAPFMLQHSNSLNRLYIRIAPGKESEVISNIEEVYHKLIPDHPFQYQFMEDVNAQQYDNESRWKKIITFASFFAIFISCIGLFGLSRLTTEQRTKEIGIRRVNGGKVFEIMAMLNKDFLKWVLLAFIVACPFAWYALDRWLQSFAYRTEIGWWIFVLSGLLASIIALTTVSWQSWRAAIRNPVESLRSE